MANILIVDDEEMDRLLSRTIVEDAGHTPFFANDGETALRVYGQTDIDIVITDLQMPNVSGLQLIRDLLERDPNAAIIAVSGSASHQLDTAEEYGAVAAFIKPVHPDQLLDALKQALANMAKGENPWEHVP